MRSFHLLMICFLSLAAITTTYTSEAQPRFSAGVSFNTFYNELRPYGTWIDMARYGRVWRYEEPGFRPYATNGQWEYTDLGWTWASNYEWGAIPFHYGRWELDPYYGWIWIPGYDYAPAWVVWSQADDYYGWAPLGFGLDINVSLGRIPSNRWMYASVGNIMRPRIDRYCIPYERNRFYYGRQRPVINVYTHHNVRYMAGPHREGRYDNRNRRYENDHNPVQRPPVRSTRRGNNIAEGNYVPPRNDANYTPGRNGRNYAPNNENRSNDARSNNPIHYDPSTYNPSRNIAGGRPERTNVPDNRVMDSRPQPRPAPSRPQISQPRTNSQPAVRETPQIQRPSRDNGGSGSRPLNNKDRRIF